MAQLPVQVDPDTEHLAIGQVPGREATWEEVEDAIRKFFYTAGLIWERLEDKGLILGNGHHIAQKLSEQQIEELKKRWARKRDT